MRNSMGHGGSPSGEEGRIVVVDDSSANLLLLEDILTAQGYEVQAFVHGTVAFASIERQPPDLVVLDVNMPQMTGYELCEKIKSDPRLSDMPVIFISALHETVDIVQGFRSGAADYISKPFKVEEVQARVETQFRLRRALRAEHDLLERTLNGAVAAVLELVQATSPALIARSNSLRDIVVTIAKGMGLEDYWLYELSAMLALVGCIALPEDLFEKAWGGQTLTTEEATSFRGHPEAGARLLMNIPRLEEAAWIIRSQQAHANGISVSGKAMLGITLLQLAMQLDQKLYQNVEVREALQLLRDAGHYPSRMLDALSHYYPMDAPFELRQIPVHEVSAGMILDEDILSISTNALIFKSGMVFTDLWVERLGNFARNHGIQKRVRVRVPRLAKEARLGTHGGPPRFCAQPQFAAERP